MYADAVQGVLLAGGLILVLVLFYRGVMNDADPPKGFCLLMFRLMCLAVLCTFSSVILFCVLADAELKKDAASFGFMSALATGSCIVVGNLFNCGKSRR